MQELLAENSALNGGMFIVLFLTHIGLYLLGTRVRKAGLMNELESLNIKVCSLSKNVTELERQLELNNK